MGNKEAEMYGSLNPRAFGALAFGSETSRSLGASTINYHLEAKASVSRPLPECP